MPNNGDKNLVITIGAMSVRGIGNFHKTLPQNDFGEVEDAPFQILLDATTDADATPFATVPASPTTEPGEEIAQLTNPQAGLAQDRLTANPEAYTMPPAPRVLGQTIAVEMTELYWMALLRDVGFDQFDTNADVDTAAEELNTFFPTVADAAGGEKLQYGVDVPGSASAIKRITPQNLFRLGLPGEEVGPYVSQFFVRNIAYGTQTIDQRQVPYATGRNYLTSHKSWLHCQRTGNGDDLESYPRSNESSLAYYEDDHRFIATMRDLARFVNKDALHQAYFNAALILLNGGAQWTQGNPYRAPYGEPRPREAGFGTLGGPHILALVSEVATRALKIVWHQKWQEHLRLRPEAYGGRVHIERIGVDAGQGVTQRPYGINPLAWSTEAARRIRELNGGTNRDDQGNLTGEETLLLPMAFTAGSPIHPAYGAGHACVAGICVTVLKAFFRTFDEEPDGTITATPLTCKAGEDPKKIGCLTERDAPYLPRRPFRTYITGVDSAHKGYRLAIPIEGLTIEGELNKLATNVMMGRSMGGVHWRTDNARSLTLGEAVAARVLADITDDLHEEPSFQFRTFSRKPNGEPKIVRIQGGRIYVDGVATPDDNPSAL